jgi:hypothetical protein
MFLRKLKSQDRDIVAGEMPVFAVQEAKQGWQVHITWPGGEEGPSIDFVSRGDAEMWITRDAREWLGRLKALSKPPSMWS